MDDKPLDDITRRTLRETEPPPRFPREDIRARIRETIRRGRRPEPASASRPRTIRVAAALAASLLIFLLGAEYGRRSGETPLPRRTAAVGPSVPEFIQAEGTEYVAAVTRFSELAHSLTPHEREQARQVALAVLYGAALELLRFAPDDPVAGTVYRSVSRYRQESRGANLEPEANRF